MAAPKGNKYSLGNFNAGQPPIFETPEELWNKALEYIESKISSKGTHATISGLSFHLGFASRQSFYDYEDRQEFSYTIKRLRTFIESCYENNLYSGAPAGAIFALKNMGWKDRVDTDLTTGGEKINNKIDLKELSTEELLLLKKLSSKNNATQGK
jgi:hypothetical protein